MIKFLAQSDHIEGLLLYFNITWKPPVIVIIWLFLSLRLRQHEVIPKSVFYCITTATEKFGYNDHGYEKFTAIVNKNVPFLVLNVQITTQMFTYRHNKVAAIMIKKCSHDFCHNQIWLYFQNTQTFKLFCLLRDKEIKTDMQYIIFLSYGTKFRTLELTFILIKSNFPPLNFLLKSFEDTLTTFQSLLLRSLSSVFE